MEPVELTKFTPTVGVSAVDANRSSRNALKPATSAKKKKPAVATAVPIIDERTAQVGQSTGSSDPSWKIRFISTDTASLIVLKDTEKEDRYKALKETWEQSQPGRASKARDARDNFIKQVEQGAIKPLTLGLNLKNPCKPWTIMNNSLKSRQTTDHPSPTQSSSSSIYVSSRPASARFFSNDARPNSAGGAFKNEPNLFDSIDESSLNGSALGVSVNWPSALGPHVLTPDEVTSKVDIREKSLLEQLQIQEDIRKRREKEKEKRAVIKVHQATVLDQKFKENEPIIRWDLDRRDTYKQSVLKQLEDALAKKAADAARLAEEQGLLNAEDNEREKKKKGAKTRT